MIFLLVIFRMNYFDHSGLKKQLKKQFPVIIIGALTLAASLAWNDAITAIINRYIPENKHKNAIYKLLYAIFLTFLIVVVMIIIDKI